MLMSASWFPIETVEFEWQIVVPLVPPSTVRHLQWILIHFCRVRAVRIGKNKRNPLHFLLLPPSPPPPSSAAMDSNEFTRLAEFMQLDWILWWERIEKRASLLSSSSSFLFLLTGFCFSSLCSSSIFIIFFFFFWGGGVYRPRRQLAWTGPSILLPSSGGNLLSLLMNSTHLFIFKLDRGAGGNANSSHLLLLPPPPPLPSVATNSDRIEKRIGFLCWN